MSSAVILTTKQNNTTGTDYTLRLPTELLSLIFILVADSEARKYRQDWTTPCTLAAVNVHWRRAALGTARLWSFMYVEITSRKPDEQNPGGGDATAFGEQRQRRADIIDQWLSRSKQVDIVLRRVGAMVEGSNFDTDDCIIEVLNKYADRWTRFQITDIPADSALFSRLARNVDLSGSSGDPLPLRDLKIRALACFQGEGSMYPVTNSTGFWFDFRSGRILQPQRLTLTMMPVERINAQWDKLVHLYVSSIPLIEVLFLLNEARSVQTCILADIGRIRNHRKPLGSKKYSLPQTPIQLQWLSRLEYRNVPSSILQHLELKGLEELIIKIDGMDLDPDITDNLNSLLYRSSCQIQKLSISISCHINISINLPTILPVVSPSLIKLDIGRPYLGNFNSDPSSAVVVYDHRPWDLDRVFQHYVDLFPDFLPRLDICHYRGPGEFTNKEKFIKAFYVRKSQSMQVGEIRSASIFHAKPRRT